MAETATTTDPAVVQALAQFSEVKGQLTALMTMISVNHTSTNQRIDDLRHSMEHRFNGVEGRVEKLETNDRATAVRVSGIAATASAVVAAGFEALRHIR